MSSRSIVLVIAAASALALVLWLATGSGARHARTADDTGPRASAPVASHEGAASSIAEASGAPPAAASSVAQDPGGEAKPASPAVPRRVEAEDAELAGAHWVEGRLILPPDTPADESVRVVARGRKFESGREHRCQVGPDGAFRVAFAEKTRKGWIELEARYLYLADGPLRVDLAELPAPLVLEPELGGWIEGRIVVPADSGVTQESLAGASVLLVNLDPARIRESLGRGPSVDVEGRAFRLRGLRPSSAYHLELQSEQVFAPTIRGLEVRRGERTEVEVAAQPTVSVAGRVVDEHGSPRAEIPVSVSVREDESSPRYSFVHRPPVHTAADGTFRLRGLAAGRLTVEADGPGMEYAERELEATEPGLELEGIEVVLERRLALTGRVQWPDGRPAKASVEVRGVGHTGWSSDYTTDADGGFTAEGLSTGNYRLEARATETVEAVDGQKERKERRQWHAEAEGVPAGTEGVVLTLGLGLSLFGTVRDDLGARVDSFRIEARPEDSRIPNPGGLPRLAESFRDVGGDFELSGFVPGTWSIQAHSKGYGSSQPVRVEVSGGSASVEFVVPRVGRVEGLVVDADGRRVARAEVFLADAEQGFLPWALSEGQSERTDASGRFVFEDVPPGSVFLRATSDAAATSERVTLTLEPGGLLADVELRLGRGGRIGGLVVDAAGRGLASRDVSLWGMSLGLPRETRSDEHGAFAFENLPAGEFRLSSPPTAEELRELPGDMPAERTGHMLARKAEVNLADGESIEVRLAPPALDLVRLRGRVLAAERPLAGAEVWVDSPDGRGEGTVAKTEEDGSYSALVSQPGRYSVRVIDRKSGLWVERVVEVPAVESLVIDFAITTSSLSGLVRGPDGAPIRGIDVKARSSASEADGSSGCETTSGRDGTYALMLPPGTYEISAAAGMWSDASASWCSASTQVQVDAERESRGIDFELRRGGTIEGTVRKPDGTVLGFGAQVVVGSAEGTPITTGFVMPEGTFRIPGVPPGSVWVEARGDGWKSPARLELKVEADRTVRVELELVPSDDRQSAAD